MTLSRLEMARALVAKIEAAGMKTGVIAIEDFWTAGLRWRLPNSLYLTDEFAVPWLLFGNSCAALRAIGIDSIDAFAIVVSKDPLAETCRLTGITEKV